MGRGFTLIELLVALVILAILAGLLIPAIGLVRERTRRAEAQQTISQMLSALALYRQANDGRRYPLTESLDLDPAPAPHQPGRAALPGYPTGMVGLLEDRGLLHHISGSARSDGGQRLLDPWGNPYRYALRRPQPTSPPNALRDWNWDAELDRPRLWDRSRTPPVGRAAPYPYLYSLGSRASDTDASTWIYNAAWEGR